MVDALTNGRKWGGEIINKKNQDVPEGMDKKMVGTGLEELLISENGVNNIKVAELDFDQTFQKMQQSFIKKLAEVGLDFPDFNASRAGDVGKVRKALKELRDQYLTEAKEYIVKLDEQDAAHPRAVARRTARTQNKTQVLDEARKQFPEAFAEMDQLDQLTPQQRQQSLIVAMAKDVNGTVYLTETNALEVEQHMAEGKANAAMLRTFQEQAESAFEDKSNSLQDFDFSVCS